MNDLISQLLGLARWDSDAESRQEESISLADLVQEVAADADYEATSQNRRVSVLESEDCIVTGSPELLRSAIENIVRNGLHYTAKDTRVEVRLSISRIDDREYAVVVVRDHGPGVPEGALKELFRPFYRVEEARDRLSGGSGLGLAIAERIIRLHGGAVTATNASEKGLQVEIRIPLRKGDEGQA